MAGALSETSAAGASTTPRPKRSQVSKACHRCRRLQKGCSASRPCQRCVKVGLEEQCLRGDGLPPKALERKWSDPRLPTSLSPETLHDDALAAPPQRHRGLLPPSVVEYCFRRFFAKLYPTIPILSPEYAELLFAEAGLNQGGPAQGLITAVCAVVLIQVEEPLRRQFEADGIPHPNRELGELLFEQATAAHHRATSSRFNPSLERVLATFFLYAGHASLFHHSQAFYFLREAATLWLVLRVDRGDALRSNLADRLFWIIMVSERSHGIRYRRPITLQVTRSAPELDFETGTDTGLSGLRNLVALFRPLDTPFFALLNQEDTPFPPSRHLSALDAIQAAIGTALEPQQTRVLCESQLTNLKVTQLWLFVILWQLRLRLGILGVEPELPCHLTFHYPVEVGEELVVVLRAMSRESISIHGVGMSEKIFDVACAMADVLSRVPITDSSGAALDSIQYLRRLIHQLPGGESTYDSLLDKHISNTLPNVLGSPYST